MKTDIEKVIELLDYFLVIWPNCTEETKIKFISNDFYCWVHSVNKNNGCYGAHKDWREEMRKTYKEVFKE